MYDDGVNDARNLLGKIHLLDKEPESYQSSTRVCVNDDPDYLGGYFVLSSPLPEWLAYDAHSLDKYNGSSVEISFGAATAIWFGFTTGLMTDIEGQDVLYYANEMAFNFPLPEEFSIAIHDSSANSYIGPGVRMDYRSRVSVSRAAANTVDEYMDGNVDPDRRIYFIGEVDEFVRFVRVLHNLYYALDKDSYLCGYAVALSENEMELYESAQQDRRRNRMGFWRRLYFSFVRAGGKRSIF